MHDIKDTIVRAAGMLSGPSNGAIKLYNLAGRQRVCPVCGRHARRFQPFGVPLRKDARCAHCGALERHRLLWLFCERHTRLLGDSSKRMLHVAPERCFEARLRKIFGCKYLTADLFDPRAMTKMDITRIDFPSGNFDIIFCNHVLEHVLNDCAAMRELYRVLSDNGRAILNVPITGSQTYEDSSKTEPAARLEAFGQEDHVRRYGRDYVGRLQGAGFFVQTVTVSDLVDASGAEKYGFTAAAGEIFLCTKRGPALGVGGLRTPN